jgi:zinc protease
MEREQVHVFLGHPGIRRTHPDYYALSVMDHVLGTGPGFTSRISKRLRDDKGLCYTVNAAISTSAGEEPGCFSAYIGTSSEHRAEAITGFLEEIERIRQEPVSAQELSDVHDYLTGSYVFAFERNTQLARYAVRAKRFDLGFDHIRAYPNLIRSVTAADVLRVAQEHLHPELMIRVSAGAG